MKTILVLSKTTGFDALGYDRFRELDKSKREELEEEHKNHTMALNKLESLLFTYKSKMMHGKNIYSISDNDCHDPDTEYDLVISLGGDGTFLNAAQRFPTSCLLGINSDYRHNDVKRGSVGALTSMQANQIEEKIPTLLNNWELGIWNTKDWPVLSVILNGEMLEPIALNEIFIGAEFGYQTCDFRLTADDESDIFNSSGVIISTGMGSHAWYRNAGGTPFSNDLQAIGVIVREPNLKRNPSFTNKVIPMNKGLYIYPEREGYKLHFDGRSEGITLSDDSIEIVSNKSIKVVDI
jgi:NAD kinase